MARRIGGFWSIGGNWMLIPRAGEHIGDFELVRRIGAGGMGVVYEARQLSTGRRVALKILSPAMTREKNRVRFLREAQAAARLQHPNIVTVHAIHDDAELCYYAMEFIEGWSLSRVLGQVGVSGHTHLPLPEFMRTHAEPNTDSAPQAETVIEEAKGGQIVASAQSMLIGPRGASILGDDQYVRQVVAMMGDVARALHYAHSQGVTHRDVKPDNLLLDHEGRLHLVDFGLARVMEEDNITLTGELMGTPLYMSPEQVAAGRIGIDHRTDLYSLGVVMYHLLGLQPPFEAPTREALLRAILVQPPRRLSSRNPAVTPELEAIVHHALEKDPDRRYASGAELADDLDHWLAGEPISLRLPGALARWWTQRSPSAKRTIAGGCAAGLILAAGLAAIMLRGHYRTTVSPPGPAEAIQLAGNAAANGDDLKSALWYAEAFRRGATGEAVPVFGLSVAYDQLAELNSRFDLATGRQSWRLHPNQPVCVVAEPASLKVWDLAAGKPLGPVFKNDAPPRWTSFDASGDYVWSISSEAGEDELRIWTTAGKLITPRPIKSSGKIVRLRTASGPRGLAVAVMTAAVPDRPGAASAERSLFNAAVYRIEPGKTPEPPARFTNIRRIKLSRDGEYLAVLTGDDVLGIAYRGRPLTSVGPAGTTAAFVFSPTSQELALAGPTGEISLKEPFGETRPIELTLQATGLRVRTAPAGMCFSPDGKYLLVLGTDTQVTPPHLRSIAVIDMRTGKERYIEYGRGAYFSEDSQTLVWWNDESVTFVACKDDPPMVRARMAVPVAARTETVAPADADPFDPALLPVQIDAQARRMLCIESGFRVTVWDVQTGERLKVLLATAERPTCRLDAAGRFALAQNGADDSAKLLSWDLGEPDAPYSSSARMPVLPVSLDALRLTEKPLVAALSQVPNGAEWSLTDPATLQPIGPSIPAGATGSRWLVSDDASVLLQTTANRMVIWDLQNGASIGSVSLPEGPEAVLAVSPTGRTAAVVTADRGLELRDLQAESAAVGLGKLRERPTQARFSRSGKHIAMAGESGRIAVYVLAPVQLVAEFDCGQQVSQMEFCLSDTLLAIGHTAGRASVWSIADGRRIGEATPADSSAAGYSPAALLTRIAIRDEPAGAAPPLLATAFANRIEIRALDTRGSGIGLPAYLQTTHGIIALAFPPCPTDAQTQPAGDDVARPCERLLVITDQAAARWFDLPIRDWTPTEWQERIATRTGMAIGADDKPMPVGR